MADISNNKSSMLTARQEHYLKKYLLGVLINREVEGLREDPYKTLPNLGGPFDPKNEHTQSTIPFLRHLFKSIVVPFPFLKDPSSKGELWPKLQLFIQEWTKLDGASNGVEREEMKRRKRLRNKAEKMVVLMYSMAVKTVKQREQEREHKYEQGGKEQELESNLAELQLSTTTEPITGPSLLIHGMRINVAGIRIIKEKRHVREHEHPEFLVSSMLTDGKEYVVARRHGHFRRLYIALGEEFPQYEFSLPPRKFSAKSGSSGARIAREKDRVSLRGYLHNLAKVSPEVVNSSIFIGFLTKEPIETLTTEEANDIRVRAALDKHRQEQQAKFDREVAKKVQELDSHMKQVKMDLLKPGGVSRLFSALGKYDKVENLPPLYQTVFEWGCMSLASTLYHVFSASDDATLNFTQLKRTHTLMPYKTMWGILKVSNPIAMMKGIMDLFLAQPFGRRSLMQRIISVNIQEEISEYKKNVTQLETVINDPGLCEKIKNYVYAPKAVIDSIFPDGDTRNKGLYDITDLGLVMDVLKSNTIQPSLQPTQIKRVWDAQQQLEKNEAEKERLIKQRQAFLEGEYDEDSDNSESEYSNSEGPDSSEAETSAQRSEKSRLKLSSSSNHRHQAQHQEQSNLIQLLQQLLVTQVRIRDKERMMGLIFQGVAGEIFKELISIFYEPLVQVYKSANIADSLMDVKDFVDELVKIVEQADVNDDEHGNSASISTLYLNLVKKHLPSFYKFVHSVHKQEDGLFRDLLEWVESILAFMRTGYAHPQVNEETNQEARVTIDLDTFLKAQIQESQCSELQKEAELLREYFSQVKDQKREKVRHMAGLDRASNDNSASDGDNDGGQSSVLSLQEQQDRERERIAKELRGMGVSQEDVEEFEMVNYNNHDDSDDDEEPERGQGDTLRLKAPKVPIIDTLQDPFVKLLDKALFQFARE